MGSGGGILFAMRRFSFVTVPAFSLGLRIFLPPAGASDIGSSIGSMILVGRGRALEHVGCDVREERKGGRNEGFIDLRQPST